MMIRPLILPCASPTALGMFTWTSAHGFDAAEAGSGFALDHISEAFLQAVKPQVPQKEQCQRDGP